MTLISVITPNYNYGTYLKEALDSILNTNSGDAFEIIVVDDSSTDNSHAVLREYAKDPRVRVFYQTHNQGIAATVNFAVSQAKGEFLHFFASDDLHEPGILDLLASKMRQFPHVALFSADYTEFEESSLAYTHHLLPCQTFSYFNPKQIAHLLRHTDFWLSGHTIFIKKTSFLKYEPRLGPACDWVNNHTLALEKGVGYLPRAIIKVRKHPHAYSYNTSLVVKRRMWLHLLAIFTKNPQQYAPLVKSGICRMLGLKAIYLDLLKTPAYWKYLFPMIKKELEKQCFDLLGINRATFWLRRL